MPVEKKLPPIRLVVDKNYFNLLVSLTDTSEENNNENSLYSKLMKYTFLEEDNKVELRFFPKEASEVILLLLCNIENQNIAKDYYEILIQNRKNYIEEKRKGE